MYEYTSAAEHIQNSVLFNLDIQRQVVSDHNGVLAL